MSRCILILLSIVSMMAACACARYPAPVPPPPQRPADFGPDPPPLELDDIVSMDSPWIRQYIVRGVELTPKVSRRWTFHEPELKFRLKNKANRKLRVDFSVVDETFRSTGPFHIEFFVNGRSVGKQRCDRAGEYTFKAPVSLEALEYEPEARVRMVMDKYWIAPSDGNRLGVQLIQVGFEGP